LREKKTYINRQVPEGSVWFESSKIAAAFCP
jgi:hypothetical protein